MVVSVVINSVTKLLLARGMDEILVTFLTSIIRWVLLLFVIVAALSQLGIDTTSLVALLCAAGSLLVFRCRAHYPISPRVSC